METKTNETLENKFFIEQLDDSDRVESFDCGDADLNDFIINQAQLFYNEKLAVNYVLKAYANEKEIAAFFSLSNDKIAITDFENKNKYNRFSRRFDNRKRLKSYPAVKIGRLGVSNLMKGKRVGSFIINFIKSYFIFNNKAGCRFLTVDAYTDAMPFYQKNGFVPLNEDDAHDKTRLLYFDLNDVSS